MSFRVELAGLFPSKVRNNVSMVCLWNEGVPSLLLCHLVRQTFVVCMWEERAELRLVGPFR